MVHVTFDHVILESDLAGETVIAVIQGTAEQEDLAPVGGSRGMPLLVHGQTAPLREAGIATCENGTTEQMK